MKMVNKRHKYKNKCLHLGESLHQKLIRSAEYHRRSMSQEACFLMELGMSAPNPPTMDDTHIDDINGRFQCYCKGVYSRRFCDAAQNVSQCRHWPLVARR